MTTASDLPCTKRPADDYFPGERITRAEAKRLCAGCPVLEKCLAYAMTEGVHGIWGGTTEQQRFDAGGRKPVNRPLRDYQKRPMKKRSRLDIPECGSETAYQRHAWSGDTATEDRRVTCEPCLEAHRMVNAIRAARAKKAS